MKTVCIGGKNNIAVRILEYIRTCYPDVKLLFVPVRNDNGVNSWQRSAKLYCEQNGIQIVDLEDIYNIDDLMFLSLEFDRIIKPERFKSDKLFNIHFSLLPKYKGVATSVLPILYGESKTGVTLHRIRRGIDTGEIIDQTEIPIHYDMNSFQLYDRLTEEGINLVKKHLIDLIEGEYEYRHQGKKESSYYSRSIIDYSKLKLEVNATANQIHNQIRAFAFRPYQLLTFNGVSLIGSRITNIMSIKKPGTVIKEDDVCYTLSSIDYDIVIYKDVLASLIKEISLGDNNKAKHLCFYNQIINEKDEHGWTPLTVAVYNNNIEMVRYLVRHGADVKVVNNNGTTLMMYAKDAYLNTGDNRLFKYLIILGLDPCQKDYGGLSLIDYCDGELLKKLGVNEKITPGGETK